MPRTERRRHPRFPFHSSGLLEIAGMSHRGVVLDLSLNGALFRLPVQIAAPIGQFCCLELLQASGPGCLFPATRIACRHDDLLGLEFVELDNSARLFLASVIDMNLAVSSLLERKLPSLLGQSAA
ncbi:MAG: hypothetical protein CVU34_11785 [Betaproteobacteria bacterium HGW-Betaproteobacteria-7]|jgi:hypothetical protein|nr:MAG: hypothetical protein CVU34_11785 [Betaproteobacteria bacterium HGW-Betaproteobacteria-7]